MDLRRIEIDLQNKKFAPIYILHGEEGYFIDKICQLIIDNALEDHERDFDQHIIYGKDAQLLNVAAELKAFPMIAQRRLVVIKEAQDFKELEKLESYASSPSPSSILVICCKYKKIRGNKKLIKNTNANGGIVYSSDKIKDYKLQEWVVSYIKKQGFEINSKAAMLLTEHIGNDLSRMINELNKLFVILKKGTNISDIDIQNNIGISKDYNVFELSNAVSEIDIKKANQIIHYFNNNPKAANTIVVVSSLFKLFSQLMKIHFIKDKTRENIARQIGVHPFVAGKLIQASRKFSSKKIAANIEILHEYDLKSKGVNFNPTDKGPLMKELIFKLLH